MRPLAFWSLVVSLAVGFSPGWSLAQQKGISSKHHPWGRYAPGAWKVVHVITETLDENGLVTQTGTTETKTTLTDIDEDGVTLEVKAVVEVAGTRFDSEPQTVKQGFHGELANQEAKIKDLGSGSVTIEDQKVPCKIEQLEVAGPTSKTTTTVYYSDTFSPYVLKRESVTSDPEGKTTLSETTVEVVAVNMPCKVLSQVKCAAEVRTVHKHPNGTILTVAFTSTDVPGGVVCHTSKELDKSGRLVRRSVLELVSYGLEPEEERTGLFGRKRPSRFRKSTTHYPPPR